MTSLTPQERDLLDRLPDATLALDAARRIAATNRAARRLLAGDATGLSLAEIVPNAEAFGEIWDSTDGGHSRRTRWPATAGRSPPRSPWGRRRRAISSRCAT
ncbi:MAG: hypothetical protein ACOVQI_14590 [Tagaea sp.]